MTTIRDVAKRCGVSAMAVSAVVNNRPGKVSPETRKRVQLIVEEMGYQPNVIARGLSRRRMNTLGVVLSFQGMVPLTSDRYYSPILDGLFIANKVRKQRSLIIAEDSWTEVQANLQSYLDGHCDGLLFVVPMLPIEAYDMLIKRCTPFVVIGESPDHPAITISDVDNVQVGYDATKYLLSLGHRTIAYFNGNETLISGGLRLLGYRQALNEAGVGCDESLILGGGYSIVSGYERARLLFQSDRKKPTAIFCGDDAIGVGAWRALRDLNVSVPQDVSLIGVNDDASLISDDMALTTIRQPLNQLSEQAVTTIIGLIDGDIKPGKKLLAHGELIIRASTAALG